MSNSHMMGSHAPYELQEGSSKDFVSPAYTNQYGQAGAAYMQGVAQRKAARLQEQGYNFARDGDKMNIYEEGPDSSQSQPDSRHHDDNVRIANSAALLESLVNYKANHPQVSDSFASLVEAAATADHTQRRRVSDDAANRMREHIDPQLSTAPSPKRQTIPDQDAGTMFLKPTKKRRNKNVVDEGLQAREREIWGTEEPTKDGPPRYPMHGSPPVGAAEARAAGVHSAAALFRAPTSASRRYTRPPMSRLYVSLELSPEVFLELQAAAKNYMLDPEYPERRDCVGTRHSPEGNVVKLKLFRCVEFFLQDMGWGEKCWGSDSPCADKRSLKWPETAKKIVDCATPLLRRVVTNERQRLYAIESRRESKQLDAETNNESQGSLLVKAQSDQSGQSGQPQPHKSITPETTHVPIDPRLDKFHSRPLAEIQGHPDRSLSMFRSVSPPSTSYHVFFVSSAARRLLRPKLVLSTRDCPNFTTLQEYVYNTITEMDNALENVLHETFGEGVVGGSNGEYLQKLHLAKISAVTGQSMFDITDDYTWSTANRLVEHSPCLEGVVRIEVLLDTIRPSGD